MRGSLSLGPEAGISRPGTFSVGQTRRDRQWVSREVCRGEHKETYKEHPQVDQDLVSDTIPVTVLVFAFGMTMGSTTEMIKLFTWMAYRCTLCPFLPGVAPAIDP